MSATAESAKSSKKETQRSNVPRHIAVIMDGNGRWARSKGFERVYGHEHGAKAVRGAIEGCEVAGVDYLTLYAFSTENWKRPKAETTALMHLLDRFLKDNTEELIQKGVRLEAIGHLDDLPKFVREQLQRSMEQTAHNDKLVLILALSYSGRMEIVDAVKNIARDVKEGRLSLDAIDTETIATNLYTHAYPDPDLLIRTSGEMRISNFLLWQLSYTEIHVTKTFWPDFRKEDLLEAVTNYANRSRRYGGL